MLQTRDLHPHLGQCVTRLLCHLISTLHSQGPQQALDFAAILTFLFEINQKLQIIVQERITENGNFASLKCLKKDCNDLDNSQSHLVSLSGRGITRVELDGLTRIKSHPKIFLPAFILTIFFSFFKRSL